MANQNNNSDAAFLVKQMHVFKNEGLERSIMAKKIAEKHFFFLPVR